MVRYIFINIILIAFTTGVKAQHNEQDYIPYRNGKLWGYCDSSKNILIKPMYDSVNFFRRFRSGPGKPDKILTVAKKGKIGVIDREGKILVPFVYSNTVFGYFKTIQNPCVAFLKRGKYDVYSILNNKLYKSISHELVLQQDGLEETKILLQELDVNLDINKLQDSVFSVTRKRVKYIIDRYGNKAPTYIQDTSFINANDIKRLRYNDSLLMVFKTTGWGIVSFFGNVIVPAEYDTINHISPGYNLFALKRKKHWSIIWTDKKLTSDFLYDSVLNNTYGSGFLVKRDGRWGVLFEDLKKEVYIDTILYSRYNVIHPLKLIEVITADNRLAGYVHFNGTRLWD
jgi:hypothetical protein